MKIPKKVMNSSINNFLNEIDFSLNPSAKELNEMDILCFISPWSENDYHDMQKMSFFNSWLLGISGKKMGVIAFNIICQEIEILRLGTHPYWRRKGLATLMLDRLELKSKNENVESIFLEVHFANKAAISLYRKKGFKEIGLRKNYFEKPSGDALLLKKLLQN